LISPHRLANAFATHLAAMAEMLDALGRELSDTRWHDVASALDAAAVRLRELSS